MAAGRRQKGSGERTSRGHLHGARSLVLPLLVGRNRQAAVWILTGMEKKEAGLSHPSMGTAIGLPIVLLPVLPKSPPGIT